MKKININSWRELCPNSWEGVGPIPNGSLVYVPLDHIQHFFSIISRTDYDYTVVSACSDYCFVEQNKEPVWQDMIKWFQFMTVNESLGYQPVLVPSRCFTERCRISDPYSIKCYSFTQSTVPEIPKNVKRWYCTNNEVQDPRIVNIPFGIPPYMEDIIGEENTSTSNRDIDIYVNFSLNTVERRDLLRNLHLLNNPRVVFRSGISHEEYIRDLKRSKFVLCPEGNGYDCYRALECIYCGAVPIIDYRPCLMKAYRDLPVLFSSSLLELVKESRDIKDEEISDIYNSRIREHEIYGSVHLRRDNFALWENSILEDQKALLVT